MRSPRQCIAILAFAVPLGLAACGGSSDSTSADETATPSEATAPATAPNTTPAEADDDGTAGDAASDASPDQQFPDVVDAVARRDQNTWTFDVTISSPYDTPERYADGWRIIGPDGAELGFRLLTHEHASEQPFTRSLDGVEIPDDVDTVTIEGRDQANGFGGETFELTLPR